MLPTTQNDFGVSDDEWLPAREAILLLELEFGIKVEKSSLISVGKSLGFMKRKLSDRITVYYHVGKMRQHYRSLLSISIPKGYKPIRWFAKRFPDVSASSLRAWIAEEEIPKTTIMIGAQSILFFEVSSLTKVIERRFAALQERREQAEVRKEQAKKAKRRRAAYGKRKKYIPDENSFVWYGY